MKLWKKASLSVIGLACFISLAFVPSQEVVTNDSDTITEILDKARNDTNLSSSERSQLLEKALLLIERAKTNNLEEVSFAALRSGDSLLFRKFNTIVLKKTEGLENPFPMGMTHWDLGEFVRNSKPDSAFYHYQKAYKALSTATLKEENAHLPSTLLLDIAGLKDDIKDYVGAEKDIIEAIAQLKNLGKSDKLFAAYNQLGVIQNGLNKPEKALEYHHKAKTYIQYARADRQEGYSLSNANNLASVYLRQKNFKTAYELYDKLEDQSKLKTLNTRLYAKVITSRAYSGYQSGQLNLDQVKAAVKQSNSILDNINYKYGQARNHEYYAQVLVAEKDTAKAIIQVAKAATLAEETNNNDRLLSALKLLSTIDGKNSAKHAQRYFVLNEDLQQKEREIQDKFARIRLETDEIIEENVSLAKDRQIFAGIAFALFIIGISVFIIINQKVHNQRLKFKQKQQESNQEIYNLLLSQQGKLEEGKKAEQKRVSEELHDGILGQLLGIRLFFSGLNERTDQEAISHRAELLEKMRDVEEEIRTISHELNEAAYEKVDNFVLSIQHLIKEVSEASHISINFDYDQKYSWNKLEGDLKINIYRILQECLQNCVKHSKCKNITVNFATTEKMLNLSVKDDGVGFDSYKEKKGIGLRNVISRTKKIKGALDIDSSPGKGALVIITIPVEIPIVVPKKLKSAGQAKETTV